MVPTLDVVAALAMGVMLVAGVVPLTHHRPREAGLVGECWWKRGVRGFEPQVTVECC